jgi:arylsulfatase A
LLKDDPKHPHRLGFDEYCLFGWHEGPRYYRPLIWQNAKVRKDVADRYGPDVYCEFLIDFITRNKNRPFLAYYSMALCHDVTNDLAVPPPFGPNGRWQTYKERVQAMDRQVGRLITVLDRLGLRKKTLVLFTTDNGTPVRMITNAVDGKYVRKPVVSRMGDRNVYGGKGSLTDGGTHVPLIANWTDKAPAGRTIDDLVDFSDFLPTLADLAGAALPKEVVLDGVSFAPRLEGKRETTRRWAYSEKRKDAYWVRTGRWKLYNDRKLFDLRKDPQEKHPVPERTSAEANTARTQLESIARTLRSY